MGWADGFWGSDPWGSGGGGGGGGGPATTLLSCLAIAENVIRLYFSAPVYFSALLDPGDASDPSHYSVTPLGTSVGRDGNPPHPMGVLFSQVGAEQASIDLVLDRPMSPAPSQYLVGVTGLLDATTGSPVTPGTAQTIALYRSMVPALADVVAPSRDVANPNSLQDFADPVSPYANTAILGTLQYDDTGDYALDEGIASYKKRVLRRGITAPGGFAFLGAGYGVGIPQRGKQLARPGTRAKLAAEWERQIAQEPETVAVSVTSSVDASSPGLVRFVVRARTKAGKNVSFAVPVSIGS
jgi:hypothetical protein